MNSNVEDQAQRLIAGIEALAERLRPRRRRKDGHAPDCSEQELRALNTLGRTGRLTMSELAAVLEAPLSTATRIVDRLAGKGLVERRQVTGDRRVVHVQFSRRGQRINQFVVDSRRSAAEAMLQALPARDRELVLHRLARMAATTSSRRSGV